MGCRPANASVHQSAKLRQFGLQRDLAEGKKSAQLVGQRRPKTRLLE